MAKLDAALGNAVTHSKGQVVLVSGEAGVGKSALVRECCAAHRSSQRTLSGSCDALFTPRPLGPFVDVAEQVGGDLERLVRDGARPHHVARGLLEELRRAPSILVLEDLHWADEATLDVFTLLSRRVDTAPALVLATYRDDELGPTHPLRIVVGELATSDLVTRIHLAPLSRAGVARLVGGRGLDPSELYLRTGGNPFFVTEVVAAGATQLPATVREAVLARAARLGGPSRALLDAVAIVPQGCEYWLLEALVEDAPQRIEECLASGVLIAGPSALSFRHELARVAVEEALAPRRRATLHERALAALASAPTPDPARLAHHAEAANDAVAVLAYAPQAGARAAALGAHREAAEQYARAARFAASAAPEVLGELFDRRAYACYLSGDFPAALDAQRQALEHHRVVGDVVRQGHAARALSLLLRYDGDLGQAWAVGREAVRVLEGLPAGHELALAYCNLGHLATASEDAEEMNHWAAKLGELADPASDVESHVYRSINVGAIEELAGDPAGRRRIEEALEVSIAQGLEEHAGRAYVNLVWWCPRGRRYTTGDRYLDAGLRYCEEHGLDLWRDYLIAYQTRAQMDRGHWDAARASADLILAHPGTSPVPRIVALSVFGLLRARRGESGAFDPLEEAWALARPTGELQRIEPIAAAHAEASWLAGRLATLKDTTAETLELATARGAAWVVGEMALWRSRAGLPSKAPVDLPEPFAAELAGDWRRASDEWSELDAPYEAALALAHAGVEGAVVEGLQRLQRLGAHNAAAIVGRRLREGGARGVPRGPRPSTRENPAGLSAREVEVLALVAAGLRNPDIAGRLVVSRRTVDHHVATILRKLGVANRAEAITEAARLGLDRQDR